MRYALLLLLALTALTGSLFGCRAPETPAGGFTELMNAVATKNADAAWERFDQASRAMLEHHAEAFATSNIGPGTAAKAQLFGSGALELRGYSRIEMRKRLGDQALLVVTDLDGKSVPVRMRLEDGLWRMHLEGADPAGQPNPFIAQVAP